MSNIIKESINNYSIKYINRNISNDNNDKKDNDKKQK